MSDAESYIARNYHREQSAEIERLRLIADTLAIKLTRCQDQRSAMLAVLPDLLDHYLHCYDGAKDKLAHEAEAAIKLAEGEG